MRRWCSSIDATSSASSSPTFRTRSPIRASIPARHRLAETRLSPPTSSSAVAGRDRILCMARAGRRPCARPGGPSSATPAMSAAAVSASSSSSRFSIPSPPVVGSRVGAGKSTAHSTQTLSLIDAVMDRAMRAKDVLDSARHAPVLKESCWSTGSPSATSRASCSGAHLKDTEEGWAASRRVRPSGCSEARWALHRR